MVTGTLTAGVTLLRWTSIPSRGGGVLPSNGLLDAAGWGRIFTTGLIIMGSSFQAFSIE